MKTLSLVTAMFLLVFGAALSRGADLTRISNETGVPVATLQAERTSTGLGWGGLEKAHLLANASGKSFDDIVALHKGGEGWGKIAHDNGLKLGSVVSNARRSSHATSHGTSSVHGKSATAVGRGHAGSMRSFSSGGRSAGHGMGGMGHGMGGMGHGRGR